MDNLNAESFIKWAFEDDKTHQLAEKMKAWQFGNKRPLLVDTRGLCLLEENALLPANLFKLVTSDSDNLIKIEQFFFAEVSKIAVIPYPDGTELLHSLWLSLWTSIRKGETTEPQNGKDNSFLFEGKIVKLKTEDLELDKIFTAFAVKLYMLPVSLFTGFNATNHTPLAAEFSLTAYSKPYNRFSLRFGCTNFVRVTFEFPHVQLADVIEVDQKVNDNADLDADFLRRQILQFISAHMQNNPADAKALWTKVQQLKYNKVANFVSEYVGKTLTFCGEKWSLISCNIAGMNEFILYHIWCIFHLIVLCYNCIYFSGALKYTYTYTSLCRNDIAGQLFSNVDGVWNDTKPMLLALRLGLFNSTGVQNSCLTDSGWNVRLVSDILTTNESGKIVELNDGCGWISMDAASIIYEKYRSNWYVKVPVLSDTDDSLINITAGLERHFLMVSDSSDLNLEWPSRDLPPPTASYLPSAFQIRYRGFKGMLVVNKALTGLTIQFTRSMKKFDSCAGDNLFIVGVSAPAHPTILSSELITMFEGGTSNQSGMLEYLECCLVKKRVDNCGNRLISLLRNPLDFLRYMGESEEAIEEFKSSKDSHLSQSRHFASRIMSLNVPLPNSAHVYGVADFTRILKPNQVYLSVSSCGQEDLKSTAFVVITKTPAMLKDHMRVFEIVHDCPQLAHLHDVLVFSTCGCELVTKQLSGADLDGDHFYVFWDELLLDLLRNTTPLAGNALVKQNNGVETQSDEDITVTKPVDVPGVEWSKMFECVQTALVVPANSFDYCSLPHLLCLRRLFIDYYGESWPRHTMSTQLSQWISATFEAPKHGKWWSWENVRKVLNQQDISEILKFPHYYPDGSVNTSTRISTSLYGRLSDKVWSILSSSECWDARKLNPVLHEGEIPLAAWISKGKLSRDVFIRSSTYVSHRSVISEEELERIFPCKSVVDLDMEGVVTWLILKAPINNAIRTALNMRHVTHAVSSPYNLGLEMLLVEDREFEGLLEEFVASFNGLEVRDGVVIVDSEEVGDRQVFDILHFAAHSLLTPAMYCDEGAFRYPNLFQFMTELDYNLTRWTDVQRACIGQYCMEKWYILFEFQDQLDDVKGKMAILRNAVKVLRSLCKYRKFPRWLKKVDLRRKRKRVGHRSFHTAMCCLDKELAGHMKGQTEDKTS